jgi:DNA polymerase-3 subunit epsilon
VICDIEATGLDLDKEIIEIALITYEDGRIVDVFETLINPLRPVSTFIQDLTAISLRELNEAPKFYDVADSIRLRLEGAVFVSHNTDFDYQLLRQKFFGIKITDRHRAIGDAKATLELFKELLGLRLKTTTRILFLPHHEKLLKKLSQRSGLLRLKDGEGKLLHVEAAFNIEKRARQLIEVKPENRDLLIRTESIEEELTGSPLIAEFKKLLLKPYRPHWTILLETAPSGEKNLLIRPLRKGIQGLWYFRDYLDARKKLRELERDLRTESFAYRDGGKSKEEIYRHNIKVEALAKMARFPHENLIIFGEGRSGGERSFILIRGGHVLGYGYAEATEEAILENPEAFLGRRFFQHLGADVTAKRYIRELKNMRQKNEVWRSLAEIR